MSDNDNSSSVMDEPRGNEVVYAHSTCDLSHGLIAASAGLVNHVRSGESSGWEIDKFCTAGAHGQLSSEFIGGGAEATLFEATTEMGDIGAVKIGLSVDTVFGAGSSGVTAKVLGTGVKADESGLEVTLFGTGMKLGKWASPFSWQ